MSEPEVPPNNPPDWRDWINEFPSIKSVALTCVVAWIVTPIVMVVAGSLIAKGVVTDQKEIDGIAHLISIWLDALNWLTLAAVFGVVTKRATEKPEVIRAEGDAKAAVIAASQSAPPMPPAKPTIADTVEIANQLAAEMEAKKLRQSAAEFEGG